MQVLKVEHDDFELVIECNNLFSAFNKAKQKQSQILSSTSYNVSEGVISILNLDSKILEPLITAKTHPLVFENKEYFIGITFKDLVAIKSPSINSKLKDVEEKFFYREALGFLAGTINYGNDLGKSTIIVRYYKKDKQKEVVLNFEVFPTKLDYRSDYDKIVADIENEYPYLVLDFLKKTYTSFKTGNSPNTDLIWWQVFGGIYNDFIEASKFILNKPHSRIINQTKYVKADKIIKWNPLLEEEYAQFKHLPNNNYRIENKTISTDTSENQFLKHVVFKTLKRFKDVKKYIERRFKNVITTSFKDEMSAIEKQMETIAINPFFKTIGEFKGLRQESLVLQKATGYSTIYKSWTMLNGGLKLFDGIQKIELKNIAELYQIWCFLEIKNVLQNLLGKENPDEIELAEIQVDDFVFKIERGVKSKVTFIQKNGERIELFHDFSYDTKSNQDVKSFTVNQRPDIVLRITKNDLKENYVLTYLYDAKYRLASDEREGAPDLPPDDAINQMHRYRDAIYYVNKNKNKPEKEVIGAYVLFPGSGELESIKNLAYHKSIDEVNIGAFPLRPNDYEYKTLLEGHLKNILGLDTESILNEVSPHKENIYESSNPEVLIGYVKAGKQSSYFENENNIVYHSGKVKPSKLKDEDSGYVKIKSVIKYFAPYYSGKGIKEYYEILDYSVVPRNEIFDKSHSLNKIDDKSERLVIRLGKKYIINDHKFFTCPIRVYRYTKLNHIRNPIDNKIQVLKIS
jgi:predicted component of viral defense system (DUF524 family)